MKKVVLTCLFSLLVWTASQPLEAARPKRWIVSTHDELLAGESVGVSITSDGRLTIAPALQNVLDTKQSLIHSMVADASGTLYVGTGNEGKIFRIPPRGEGGEWVDLDENGVLALAVDSQNRLYAATSPDGKVYRISGQNQSETFFQPREKYIWDLQFDRQGNLLVATGPKGKIYRVSASGDGTAYYDASESHIVDLALDQDGQLLAGTSPGGQLIRFSSDGRPFVLYDSALEEIRGITADRYGNVYAAGISFDAAATSKATESKPSDASAKQNGSAPESVEIAGLRKGKKLEVYRVDRAGLGETLYSADTEAAFDLLVRSDAQLLIGSSKKGRILAASPDRFVRLITQTSDEQVTRLVETGGTVYVATSNLGKVYRLQSTQSAEGRYQSDVLDAQIASRWGKMRWQIDNPQQPAPTFQARAGNTEKPDKTWSEWQAVGNDGQIGSPNARYFQWQATFRGSANAGLLSDANSVDWVEVNYLQRNVAPVVQSITVHPAGVALMPLPLAANPATVALGGPQNAHLKSLPEHVRELTRAIPSPPPQKMFVPGARSFTWTASDANGDDLSFQVAYRRIDESQWQTATAEPTRNYLNLDGASLPDGTYVLKVIASDHPSNPSQESRKGELVSRPFVIANAPPTITTRPPSISGVNASIKFTAQSSSGSVFQAEYSVNGTEWFVLAPADGIADSPSEEYEFTLENLSRGSHSIIIRVADNNGNLGTTRVPLNIQ